MNRKYKYTEEDIRKAVSQSSTVYEVMRRLNIRLTGGSHSHITNRIKTIGIDISHFTGRAWNKNKPCPRRTAEDILILYPEDHIRISAKLLRRALTDIGITKQCVECGITDVYNNKPIVLHIDHINGIFIDCRKENLRFLCPNCHSQTETFGNKISEETKRLKRRKYRTDYLLKKPNDCKICGKNTKRGLQYCSYSCSNIGQRKIVRPPKDEIIKMIKETSYCAVARQFGVSDNAIRKWIK